MRWGYGPSIALLIVVLTLGMLGMPATQAAQEHPTDDRYIVVLDSGQHSGQSSDVAAEHSRRYGAEPLHVYDHVLAGYAARMSPQTVERVRNDRRVDYVEADRRVTIATHTCGHSSFPFGGGECATGDVFGTVTDADTGDPIQDATVTLEEAGDSDTTNSSGEYRIVDVDGGEDTATAEADGYESQSQSMTVDGDTEVNFELNAESEGGQVVPWGVKRVGAPSAHDDDGDGDGDVFGFTSTEGARTGEGVPTYVLDTGIDVDHVDMNVVGGHAVIGCSGSSCDRDYDDDHGHGTHVAGIAGALDNDRDVVGVAPDTSLWAVKVLDDSGGGFESDIIAGLEWVADETAAREAPSVANMSFAAPGSKKTGGECADSGFTGEDSLHEAICNAKNDGVVFTVAAGNNARHAEDVIPAAYDDTVMTVSATDETDDWPTFSNWGNDPAGWTTNESAPVALAAPGVHVLSTQRGGGTTTLSGTSMAAPHVAGGAALFLEANPQAADGSAFEQTRTNLLDDAESTADFSNTSGNPHDEDFLDVR